MNFTEVAPGFRIRTDEYEHRLIINGTPVVCPAQPRYVRAAVNSAGELLIVVKSQSPGTAFVINLAGAFAWLDGDCVEYPAIAARQDGYFTVAFVTSFSARQHAIVSPGCVIEWQRPLPLPDHRLGTSQGLLDLTGDTPIYTDDVLHHPGGYPTYNGVAFNLVMHRGVWTVGQGQDVGGVLAFNRSTNQLYRVSKAPTNQPPRLALEAGAPVVAISFGAGLFVPFDEFTPYVPDVDPDNPDPDKPMPPESLEPLLKEYRRDYPDLMTDAQAVELLNRVAWARRADGWGLRRKESGNHGVRHDGARCSVDWLLHLPTVTGVDCLADAGLDRAAIKARAARRGQRVPTQNTRPQWGELVPFEKGVFVPPIEPKPIEGGGDPDPDKPDDELAVRVGKLEATAAALKHEIEQRDDALRTLVAGIVSVFQALEHRVVVLEKKLDTPGDAGLADRVTVVERRIDNGGRVRILGGTIKVEIPKLGAAVTRSLFARVARVFRRGS